MSVWCVAMVAPTSLTVVMPHVCGIQDRRRRAGQSSRLSTSELYLCGFLAGGANSVVSSPVEHIRIRMQVQTNAKGEAGLYQSTPDCARKVLSQYGLRGFYKGFVPSIIRESFGYGVLLCG